jgi:hypothetical protein
MFFRCDLTILEGLVKEELPGKWELIALPLQPVGFDAGRVRSQLWSLDQVVRG